MTTDRPTSSLPNEINVKQIFMALWSGKWLILSISSLSAIAVVIYVLSIPNYYQSEALLAPATQQSASVSRNPLGQYSGLASLAGIDITNQTANTAEAIKLATSLHFFENSILPNMFLPNLMALKEWDQKNNKITYHDSIYDENSKKWVRKVSFPLKQIPSAQESYKVFLDHFSLEEDPETGFVEISIEHQSPYVASKWLNLVIDGLNSKMREDQKARSSRSIDYLNNQISRTNLTEIKTAISSLIQKETQTLMTIEASDDYIFKSIDPPYIPELKSRPSRGLICILVTFLSGMLSSMYVLIRHYQYENEEL